MHIYLISLTVVLQFLFADWHARGVFIAAGYRRRYGHGKSYNRAQKHYKATWTFFQRMLWIPLFKEWYEDKYRAMAYLSYIHVVVTVATEVCFLINEYAFPEVMFWHYVFSGMGLFFIIRFIYDNAIGQGRMKKK